MSPGSAALLLTLILGGSQAAGGTTAADLIGLDLERLHDSGLYGPPNGRRSLSYELCIPSGPLYREEVATIDPSARFQPGSRGRVGCASHQVLVIGDTHQPGFQEILASLAALPYVDRIVEALFE